MSYIMKKTTQKLKNYRFLKNKTPQQQKPVIANIDECLKSLSL